MAEIIMWVGVGDNRKFHYWPSLSSTKLGCKRKIYDWLYTPIGEDKPDWSDWELRQVSIRWLNASYVEK